MNYDVAVDQKLYLDNLCFFNAQVDMSRLRVFSETGLNLVCGILLTASSPGPIA
jgi:hypothetical protein